MVLLSASLASKASKLLRLGLRWLSKSCGCGYGDDGENANITGQILNIASREIDTWFS